MRKNRKKGREEGKREGRRERNLIFVCLHLCFYFVNKDLRLRGKTQGK